MSASIQGNGIINNQPIYMNIPITNVTVGPAPSSLVTVFFTLPSIPPYTTITNATIYSGTGLSNSLTSISSQSSSITLSGLAGNITYNGFYLVFTYSTGVIMQTQTFSVTTKAWNVSQLIEQSVSFNGTNQYGYVADSTFSNTTTGTYEAWIKVVSYTNDNVYRPIIVKHGGQGGLCLYNGIVVGYNGATTFYNTGINVADNTWHHVLVSFQSGVTNGYKIYIDDVLKLTNTVTLTTTTNKLSIGVAVNSSNTPTAVNGSTSYFNGKITEIRAWNYAFGDTEVNTYKVRFSYLNEPGLIGYWRTISEVTSTITTLGNIVDSASSQLMVMSGNPSLSMDYPIFDNLGYGYDFGFSDGMCCSVKGDVVWAAHLMRSFGGSTSNFGCIFYSSNYGQQFSFITNLKGLTPNAGCSLHCDDSGNTLWFTVNSVPYKYVKSTDTLTNFSSVVGSSSVFCANSSSNQYIISAKNGSYYYSTNYGTNFTNVTDANIYSSTGAIGYITMDNTGQYIAMAGFLSNSSGASKLVVSTNYGVNFNVASSNTIDFPSASSTTAEWGAVQYNYNGSMLVAALGKDGATNSVFTSTDYGATWNTIISNYVNYFGWGGFYATNQSIAVDITGTKIVLSLQNGPLYSYSNGNLTYFDPSLNSINSMSGITSDVSGNFYIYAYRRSSDFLVNIKYYKSI